MGLLDQPPAEQGVQRASPRAAAQLRRRVLLRVAARRPRPARSALRYLERAYEERSTVLAYLLIDPRLATLRDDSRFVALARRLGGE